MFASLSSGVAVKEVRLWLSVYSVGQRKVSSVYLFVSTQTFAKSLMKSLNQSFLVVCRFLILYTHILCFQIIFVSYFGLTHVSHMSILLQSNCADESWPKCTTPKFFYKLIMSYHLTVAVKASVISPLITGPQLLTRIWQLCEFILAFHSIWPWFIPVINHLEWSNQKDISLGVRMPLHIASWVTSYDWIFLSCYECKLTHHYYL